MPVIFLSPSTQDYNLYITGNQTEESSMNLLTDALIPYLDANAIAYQRNDPDGTASDAIRLGNAGEYNFYLALHSNASPPESSGDNRGIIAFYYPGSPDGQRGAELIAEELREIYPLPQLVYARPITTLGEVRRPRAPAVLVEIGYHDNYQDAIWINNNRPEIAEAIAKALTRYFNLPFIYPFRNPAPGKIQVNYGTLNLRSRPESDAPIIANMPNHDNLIIFGEYQGWYSVRWRDYLGYAAAAYINII